MTTSGTGGRYPGEGYVEARMLEDNRFDGWLDCFTNDVHYWMPVRQSTDFGSGSATARDAFCLFDDDKKSLELRVLRIKSGDAHAELPPSVTCRLITNIFGDLAVGRTTDGSSIPIS